MRLLVGHSTRYEYADAVLLSYNMVRLRPRNHGMQRCLRHELVVVPAPSCKTDGFDYFGNHVAWFNLQEPHTRIEISAHSEVELTLALRPDVSCGFSWEQVQQILLSGSDLPSLYARQFRLDSHYVSRSPELADYAFPSFLPGRPFLECVLDLTERIHSDFKFLPGSTKVGTPILEVLRSRKGVCQDFAHLQLGCLRSLGFAARYVSGYIVTRPPPGQRRLEGADVSHAWISVFAPDFGWIDFDPTNGIMPSDGHITVAWARDYDDLGPVRGIVVGGRRQKLDVSVDVVPAEAL